MTVVLHPYHNHPPPPPSGLNMCKLQGFKKGSTLCKDLEKHKRLSVLK